MLGLSTSLAKGQIIICVCENPTVEHEKIKRDITVNGKSVMRDPHHLGNIELLAARAEKRPIDLDVFQKAKTASLTAAAVDSLQ